jgi:HAMP domain-containing protein
MSITDAFRTAGWRRVSVRGEAIYDVRVPIVDDEKGAAAHMGIRKESVDRQIHAALFPAVTLIAIIVVGGIVLVFFFVSRLTRPFLRLAEVARQMSDGHLDTPPTVNARDEVGDLALSLERMRSSLKAVMRRLDHHPPSL